MLSRSLDYRVESRNHIWGRCVLPALHVDVSYPKDCAILKVKGDRYEFRGAVKLACQHLLQLHNKGHQDLLAKRNNHRVLFLPGGQLLELTDEVCVRITTCILRALGRLNFEEPRLVKTLLDEVLVAALVTVRTQLLHGVCLKNQSVVGSPAPETHGRVFG